MSPTAREWHHLTSLLFPRESSAHSWQPADEPAWIGIYRLATEQLVAPQLYESLHSRGQLNDVPKSVQMALSELFRLSQLRNEGLRKILRDTIRRLNEAGMEPLLLKGSIALLPNQYPLAGSRLMNDLDLALHNAEAEAAERVLRKAGYRDADNIPDPDSFRASHHHLAPLVHPSRIGYVELHRELMSGAVPKRALSLQNLREAAVPIAWDGLRLWQPSLEHRLLHNALHQQVQNRGLIENQCSLRQLLEFVSLMNLPAAREIDWPTLLSRLDHYVYLAEAVRAYLLQARQLFGQPIPPGVDPGFLARLSDWRLRFGLEHRLTGRLIDGLAHYGWRLPNLPKRLMTPQWYPEKMRYLRSRWLVKKGTHPPP